MDISRPETPFRDAHTPYSAEKFEKHPTSPFLTGTVQLLDFSDLPAGRQEKPQKLLRRSSHQHGTQRSRLTSARLGDVFSNFHHESDARANAIILRWVLRIFPRFLILLLPLLFIPPAFAADASLFISPIAGTYIVNEEAQLRVFLSSDEMPVNAVEGTLVFDPKKIFVSAVSKADSVLTSWVTEPRVDNEKGEIYFGGTAPTGSTFSRAPLLTISFMPLRAENFRINFANGAAILAADGTGGNIVSILKGGEYTALPKGGTDSSLVLTEEVSSVESNTVETASDPALGEVLGVATGTLITSPTHPDQSAWYPSATSTIVWGASGDLTRLRLSLNKHPEGEGVTPYDPALGEKTLEQVSEGVWYVHVTRGWSDGRTEHTHYRLQIDTTPPEAVSISEKPGRNITDSKVTFLVSATDTLSGIDHYEFAIDGGRAQVWVDEGTHEYHASSLLAGPHELAVAVVDRAGNKTKTSYKFSAEYLPTPVLMLEEGEWKEGKSVRVLVKSIPNAKLRITTTHGDTPPAVSPFIVNESGEGVFMSPPLLLPGTYTMRAVAESSTGGVSRESEGVTFVVETSVWGVLKRHPLIPLALLALLALLFFAYTHFRHIAFPIGDNTVSQPQTKITPSTLEKLRSHSAMITRL